ncbi:MAG: hypothetical protein V8Q05_09785 [Lachnospiraceae bacterium]
MKIFKANRKRIKPTLRLVKRCVTPLRDLRWHNAGRFAYTGKKYSAIRERAKEKIEIKNQPSAPTPALITGQTDKSP